MSESVAVLQAPPAQKRYRSNGKNLRQRLPIVQACLAQGLSNTQTAHIAGVSRDTVGDIKRAEDFTSPEGVQRVRERLRDKATMQLDSALDISPRDLAKSKLSERSSLIRALAPLAGLSEPNHMQTQINILNNYAGSAPVDCVVIENQNPINTPETRMDTA